MPEDLSVKEIDSEERLRSLRRLLTGKLEQNQRIHLESVEYGEASDWDSAVLKLTLRTFPRVSIEELLSFFDKRSSREEELLRILAHVREVMEKVAKTVKTEEVVYAAPSMTLTPVVLLSAGRADFLALLAELQMMRDLDGYTTTDPVR